MTEKVWISTDYVPESSRRYLTPGKRYEVTKPIDDRGRYIIDDADERRYCRFKNSLWLDGRDWTVHTEPLPEAEAEADPVPSPLPGTGFVIAILGALLFWLGFFVGTGLSWMVMR
jgi:hypothetical protein